VAKDADAYICSRLLPFNEIRCCTIKFGTVDLQLPDTLSQMANTTPIAKSILTHIELTESTRTDNVHHLQGAQDEMA
jgi:hypothetical protein